MLEIHAGNLDLEFSCQLRRRTLPIGMVRQFDFGVHGNVFLDQVFHVFLALLVVFVALLASLGQGLESRIRQRQLALEVAFGRGLQLGFADDLRLRTIG